MLATQMQVLNSGSSFLRGTCGQTLRLARPRHAAKLGVLREGCSEPRRQRAHPSPNRGNGTRRAFASLWSSTGNPRAPGVHRRAGPSSPSPARCSSHVASRREPRHGLEPLDTQQSPARAVCLYLPRGWRASGAHLSCKVPISGTTHQSPALPT